jgi:hypothetical protein
MPRQRRPYAPRGATAYAPRGATAPGRAAALPFRGRNGRRNSIAAAAALLLLGTVVTAVNPILAALAVAAAWLCIALRLAWQQSPLWASTFAVSVAITAAATLTFASTTVGQRPARAVTVQLDATSDAIGDKLSSEARDCLVRFIANRPAEPGCLWGKDTTPRGR